MHTVNINKLKGHIVEEVTLRGWLFNKRSSGKIRFFILRDGTGYVQCVFFKGNESEESYELSVKPGQESSLEVTGKVKEDQRQIGGYEIGATDLKILQNAKDDPIIPKEHGTEFLLDHRHLWLRSKNRLQFCVSAIEE
jgi:asparaginyl-tRNA synthetase